METESYKRKLTAILSADVQGYSRLMGEDEDATIKTLTTYRELMTILIQKHRGRVVDSPGDNLLAEFLSVVDAVRCAVEIQEELRVRNAELPENRRMHFRIGINLGDVVQEEERIYGDGINIAARVEGLAEGGGICISGTVYDSIKNKLSLTYESLGEHTVKNITEPVRVYRMRVGPETAVQPQPRYWHKAALAAAVVLIVAAGAWAIWNFYFRPPPIEPASVEKMAFPLPDKPSIAVLPFTNMSGDPKQEYFSDGLTEEIITALSKVPYLFVIARNSTFTYKGKPVKIRQVAEELGVRYVLEGSFRKVEDRVRLTAQLIDAITGHHLWAERYERDLKDIFALQDEITLEILRAMEVKLTEGDQARMYRKGTVNIEAYVNALKAIEHNQRFNKDDNMVARRMCEEAIALDPNYARPYRVMAYTHLMEPFYGTSKSPKKSMKRALELAKKAVALDDSHPCGHELLSYIFAVTRQYEKAIVEAEQAIALDPNGADSLVALGYALSIAGRPEEAIVLINKAIRSNPIAPGHYFGNLGRAYRMTGKYDEAIVAYKKSLERSVNNILTHVGLTATYSLSDRDDMARSQAKEVLRVQPKFSVNRYVKKLPFKDKSETQRLIDALRKAGLPDKPPLQLPDKPSIAVLAFENMSGDPEQEYFSDGITEEIITALSKTPKLFVIARNSTFTYKNKPAKVQKVGRELGVKYVLEGSVRKAGDKVRITAQLIDAQSGHHLWAERYDRDLKDVFAIQDEITKKIITALQVKLTEGEMEWSYAKGTDNLEAYLKFLQGREHLYRFNKENNALAKQLLQEAIALDPEYPKPYAFLSTTHMLDMWLGSSKSPRESLAQAIELAEKAIALDDSYANAHGVLGNLYIFTRQYDKGIAECERGVALDPNSADALGWLGQNLYWADRPEEVIPVLEKAIRLNPIPQSWYLYTLAMAFRDTGRYEEAISACKKVFHREPKNVIARLVLAATYSLSGREEEARAEAAEILRIDPKFSLEGLAKTRPHKNQANTKSYIDALRKAGLPE